MLTQGRLGPRIYFHQTRLRFISLQPSSLVSLCLLQRQISFLGWQEWNPTWFSIVVAYLPQGLMSQHTCKECLFNYCSISLSSNQSCHSPFTSLINMVFLSKELPLTRWWWSPQEMSNFRNIQTSPSGTAFSGDHIYPYSDIWCEH